MPINNVFIFNPIRPDFIGKCISSLHKHTDMKDNRVILVDQTMNGLFETDTFDIWRDIRDFIHLYIRPHRNLGFSKAHNEGIIHGLRWGAKYITCSNDDIEYMDDRWWDGIVETFNQDDKIMAVNPMSPREPGWGYGLEHGKYLDIIDYKEEFTKEDYDFLLSGEFSEVKKSRGFPASFPDKKVGVIDAIATWSTTFKSESFKKFGLFDERYYPGGGEDYDYNARVYKDGYRMVGTTRSWVWHWWGSSKDTQEHKGKSLPAIPELVWMNPDELWPPERNMAWNKDTKKYEPKKMDPWARLEQEDGSFKPMYRISDIGIVDI